MGMDAVSSPFNDAPVITDAAFGPDHESLTERERLDDPLHPRAKPRRWVARLGFDRELLRVATGLAIIAALATPLIWLAYGQAMIGIRSQSPIFWLVLASGLLAIAAGIRTGNRVALLFALLFGVPLELPFFSVRDEARAIARKSRWLASFAAMRARGFNTHGAHLACGAISTKRTLKQLCLNRERRDAVTRDLERRRADLVRDTQLLAGVIQRLLDAADHDAAQESRREYVLRLELFKVERDLFLRRLAIQDEVVAAFRAAWKRDYEDGHVSAALHQRLEQEFRQPESEPASLLPDGLVRGPLAFTFEYGMFFGRLLLAVLLVSTFQSAYVPYALVLLALGWYVVEPVVMKLHLSSFNLLFNAPGHSMLDLRRHLLQELPPDAVFRVPITIPKFSSNPAAANLDSVIKSACRKAGVTPVSIRPFALREARTATQIELSCESTHAGKALAVALRRALESELLAQRALFPLPTEVSIEEGRVVVSLTGSSEDIWAMIGEDASQAFTYLWRSLRALRDTLTHLGPKFRPVFILASNSTDADVVHYEIDHIEQLQQFSDREYDGQVGFLYLLKGGEWSSYNALLPSFESTDKEFAKAASGFRAQALRWTEAHGGTLIRTLLDKNGVEEFASAFNALLKEPDLYREFVGCDFNGLPQHSKPSLNTLAILERRGAGAKISTRELRTLNRELLLTAVPMSVPGGFFKKVGNDLAVQELLVEGRTTPSAYTSRGMSEHVQNPRLPSYVKAWGDFARYTGLKGSTDEIVAAILGGRRLEVESTPEVGVIMDDKNDFAPGELEKGLATMMHSRNRHVVIGVPRIDITLPEQQGHAVQSKYLLSAQAARRNHNAADGLVRALVFDGSSAAYGKWFARPKPYLAHYSREVLNAAHALSHDFQQSYLIAGASGQLAGFSEALYGPSEFRIEGVT